VKVAILERERGAIKSHDIAMAKAERLYQLERPPFTSVSFIDLT